jgi:hypothetical protein
MPRSVLSKEVSGSRLELRWKSTKPPFYGNEWTQSTLGGLQRRAEQAMGNANRRAPNRDYIAVCNVAISLVKVDPVIVSKFRLHHDFAMNAVTEASAESEVVGAGLGNAEVIEKYTSLDALLCE